jgi:transcriptional regulator with XRE-family HTH domain
LREIIGARLKEERERLGYNQIDFAAIGGASNRSQVDWEKGKQMPNAEFLALIAAVGVDVQYVLTGAHSNAALAKDEEELIANYRALNAEDKAEVHSNIALTQDERELLAGYRTLDIRGKVGVLGMIDGLGSDPSEAVRKKQAQLVHTISGKSAQIIQGAGSNNNISTGKTVNKIARKKKDAV